MKRDLKKHFTFTERYGELSAKVGLWYGMGIIDGQKMAKYFILLYKALKRKGL